MQSDETVDNFGSPKTPFEAVIDSLNNTTDLIRLTQQFGYLKKSRSEYEAKAELVLERPEQVV